MSISNSMPKFKNLSRSAQFLWIPSQLYTHLSTPLILSYWQISETRSVSAIFLHSALWENFSKHTKWNKMTGWSSSCRSTMLASKHANGNLLFQMVLCFGQNGILLMYSSNGFRESTKRKEMPSTDAHSRSIHFLLCSWSIKCKLLYTDFTTLKHAICTKEMLSSQNAALL